MVKDSGVPEQPVASIIGVTVTVDISEAVAWEFAVKNEMISPLPAATIPVFVFVFVQL